MPYLNSLKLNLTRSKSAAMVLVICFSIMVLFGSPLHDHDLKSSHVDLDCISCHLVHANVGLDHDKQDFFVGTQYTQSVSISTTPLIALRILSVSSRGPPVACWFFFKKYINNLFWPAEYLHKINHIFYVCAYHYALKCLKFFNT